ncbi:hypothetical protein LTR37_002358 [Vermiconidia calcicola]|uniref:Uncharacterized protein n=1 Tax=Vermiconidia calcicola TaxID=1690605 RepID=A0ACC3NTQ1_9PEZI|nr:hypothetical protein LTR37_002358 [Vermiconidia calcicola]
MKSVAVQMLSKQRAVIYCSDMIYVGGTEYADRDMMYGAREYGNREIVYGARGMHVAAYHGLKQITECLLEAGANPNEGNARGMTPLAIGVIRGSDHIVDLLLGGYADPNSVDVDGKTPLSRASSLGHVSIARKLVAAGASVLHEDEYGRTPLMVAVLSDRTDVVHFLQNLPSVDINHVDHDGNTALALAIKGSPVDSHSTYEYLYKIYKIVGRSVSFGIVGLLLANSKVNPNIADADGHTPFLWAAMNDRLKVAKLLLSTGGMDPDIADVDGCTPLSWAARSGRLEVVQLLLNTGKVDPDHADGDGRTPLSWAAQNHNLGIVQLLLNTSKVDPDSVDGDERTPFSWPAQNDHSSIVQLLIGTDRVDQISADNKGRTPLHWAALCEADFELVYPSDPDAADVEGYTPCMLACHAGNCDIVELLLNTGRVNPELIDAPADTILHGAVERGQMDMVRFLLQTGKANPWATNHNGETPIQVGTRALSDLRGQPCEYFEDTEQEYDEKKYDEKIFQLARYRKIIQLLEDAQNRAHEDADASV